MEIDADRADYMDVSPKMVVSVATAMIPFPGERRRQPRADGREHAAPGRAASEDRNSRSSRPAWNTRRPSTSGVCVIAKEDGVVERVDATEIQIRGKEDGQLHKYEILKFKRSNQGTCVNQRPIVSRGEEVKKGQVIADGPATCNGEISLGKNALIGFMTWEGYNYEDAVPDQRAPRPGRRLHLDPHRGV